MADYCTEADVKENLKAVVFSGSSAVTTTAIGNIIDQESALIDAHIYPRYTLPIVNATALNFLKRICIALCVYRVTKILNPLEVKPLPDNQGFQEISHASAYKDAMRMLKDIAAGKMFLPLESDAGRSLFSSTAVNDDVQTVLVSEEKQW